MNSRVSRETCWRCVDLWLALVGARNHQGRATTRWETTAFVCIRLGDWSSSVTHHAEALQDCVLHCDAREDVRQGCASEFHVKQASAAPSSHWC